MIYSLQGVVHSSRHTLCVRFADSGLTIQDQVGGKTRTKHAIIFLYHKVMVIYRPTQSAESHTDKLPIETYYVGGRAPMDTQPVPMLHGYHG